ncbi:unnamed protein product [Coregonus sp. 'balchen']|nr:unnamed protein product [Coregonus sp. 'balchen']
MLKSVPRVNMDTWLVVSLFVFLQLFFSLAYEGTPWCAPIKVKHGDVSCRSPGGQYYKNVMGSRCKIRCKSGYEMQQGHPEVVCMASKHWSGNYACREIRCPKLQMPANGGYKCSDGSYFNSRYVDAPVIKCPNLKDKTAEPGKLSARVTWDTPEGKDTADGILTDVILKGKPPGHFPEGLHKMSYTVYDRAGNKGSCRFSVRVRAMNINVGVRTASGLLDQFYEKRRLLIISAPTAANHYYRFQMTNLQHAQCGLDLRHVTVIELVGIYPAQIGRISHRLIPPGLALQLRLLLQISHDNFNMVMIDKQGMDRERYTYPITSAQIFTTIDTWQGRMDEMVLQQEAGHTCQ